MYHLLAAFILRVNTIFCPGLSVTILPKVAVDRENRQQYQLSRHPLTYLLLTTIFSVDNHIKERPENVKNVKNVQPHQGTCLALWSMLGIVYCAKWLHNTDRSGIVQPLCTIPDRSNSTAIQSFFTFNSA